MPVAADLEVQPSLDEVRALAAEHTLSSYLAGGNPMARPLLTADPYL